MKIFKVSCNHGKDKGASTKAEREDYFITRWRAFLGYKKISKKNHIPRETIGSIIRKFKTYGAAANLPGHGREPNISSRALTNFVRTTQRNPCVTARHLQDDLMKAGTSASVATIRRALNKQGLPGLDSKTHSALSWQHEGPSKVD